MKATKIMGAVLVAMLAAALFVGAASAADTNYGSHFVYEIAPGLPAGTYVYGSNTVEVDAAGVITPGSNFASGYTYTLTTNGKQTMIVSYPTADVKMSIYGTPSASIIDGNVPNSAKINISVTTPVVNFSTANGNLGLIFNDPKGTQTTVFADKDMTYKVGWSFDNIDLSDVMAGEWKVNAYFKAADANFTNTMPQKYQIGEKTYKFTVTDVTEKITLSGDSVIKGNTFKVTLTGTPGKLVNLTAEKVGIEVVKGQINVIYNTSTDLYTNVTQVKIGDSGSTVVSVKATGKDGSYKINAYFIDSQKTKDASVKVLKGTVTLAAAADSYFIGEEVKLTGTNTQADKTQIYVKGANTKYIFIGNTSVKSDNTWELKINKNTFTKYDSGTYTFYAIAENAWIGADVGTIDSTYVYTSASVALKQPFLTATASSSVVPQKSKLTISGSAEATDDVQYYIFGTNKFATGTESVEKDGTYSFEIDIAEDKFATGQYFVVIQHKMYNKTYDVTPVLVAGTSVGNKESYNIQKNGVTKFNTLERQSANGAQALCDELDDQSIDDIYVKLSFIVGTPYATMNPVSDVTKGTALKVSGTTNVAAGKLVTVDMLSTAFAAVPKETVGSASFITLTTKVIEGKDGVNTWEVTFDTSKVNVDEYTISAAVEGVSSTTAKVKVLEGTPTVKPTETGTATVAPTTAKPTTTTPTTTPGFGGILALAGLGAVAVLLLRRE